MQLNQLFEILLPLQRKGNLDLSYPLTGLTVHSAAVQPGQIFVALPSVWEEKAGGEQYVGQALAAGAQVIVSVLPAPQDFPGEKCWVQVADAHVALSQLARAFYPRQPRTVVAVTGTNGKSSIVDFTFQLWQSAGLRCARMGTIGVEDSFGHNYAGFAGLTTPDAIVLHQNLEALAGNGVEYVAMEASSHAIKQHRMDGVHLKVASFTNMTQEHLDYHKDTEDYFKSKARLFKELLPLEEMAVLNRDDPVFPQLESILRERSLKGVSYGSCDADIQYRIEANHEEGQDITITVFGTPYKVCFPLIGEFQVSNAVCALTHAVVTGVSVQDVIAGLSNLKSVPGRLQKVNGQVYVDYAHSPDALATSLKALRPHARGRLLVVFGCGGNRDPFKRPVMGRIAAELADVVFVADDNPRLEDPAVIRKEILQGCPEALEFETREEAIYTAVKALKSGDILLIAGKGHETGQIIGTDVQPFNDVTVAQEALANVG
jgi:UDP-N-acetylmuramoyl-L-alanyl-D-glutamate--2,6-diaminopimelate ligase